MTQAQMILQALDAEGRGVSAVTLARLCGGSPSNLRVGILRLRRDGFRISARAGSYFLGPNDRAAAYIAAPRSWHRQEAKTTDLMTFEAIGHALEISHQEARSAYQSGMRKLRRSRALAEMLITSNALASEREARLGGQSHF
jgi:hypothetical protein